MLVFTEYKLFCEGLSIEYKEHTQHFIWKTKKYKTTAIRKWKPSLWLGAWKAMNYFLKDWFSNCRWLETHFIHSYGMEIQISRIKRAHSTFHMINKKIQNDCYEKMKGFSLAGGLEGNDLFPEGLILQLLLAGETFYSFLLDGN